MGLVALRGEEEKAQAAPKFDGKLFGMNICVDHFGVILDVSESMEKHLPKIRQSLKKKIPRNPVVHVNGCALVKPALRAQLKNGVAPDTVTAAELLGKYAKVNGILWICDQGDPPNRDGVIAMKETLSRYGIQLMLVSIRGKPGPSVRKVIEGTEGIWKVVDSI